MAFNDKFLRIYDAKNNLPSQCSLAVSQRRKHLFASK